MGTAAVVAKGGGHQDRCGRLTLDFGQEARY